jgi:membrane protein DedA with SNARE-associated domain
VDLQTTLLDALSTYGPLAIFVSILISAVGLPLPTSFLLIVAGSFVAQASLELWQVLIAGIAGAVIGDHIGYGIGWWAGHEAVARIGKRMNALALIDKAEAMSNKWGGVSIFFSRWFVTAVGPYINFTSGIARYRPPLFTLFVVLGEALWVGIYVALGYLFSDSLSTITDALGDFTWLALGVGAIVVLGYLLLRNRQKLGVA